MEEQFDQFKVYGRTNDKGFDLFGATDSFAEAMRIALTLKGLVFITETDDDEGDFRIIYQNMH